MVDHSAPHSSRFLSSFPALQSRSLASCQAQSPSLLPSTSAAASSPGYSNQPRSTTPACFLRSGSPLPPTSAYALASSVRSLGTPTSDIRATSPSAQAAAASACCYPDPDTHHLHQSSSNWSHPAQSTHSPTSPFDFGLPSAPTPLPPAPIVDCNAGSQAFIPPVAVQSSSSAGYVEPLSPTLASSRLGCFWAILDEELRFVYVDPRLQHELDGESETLLSTTIYHYIHPADIDGVMSELDPEQVSFLPSSTTDPGHVSRGVSGLVLPSPTSAAVDRRPASQHRVIRSCRFARLSHLRRLLRRDEGYFVPEDSEYEPVKVFLNPIGDTHLLCFFHALSNLPAAQAQVNEHVAPLFRPVPPTAAAAVPHSTCGVIDANPGSAGFSPKQALKLESALLQSAQTRAEASPSQNCLDVFQILDSATGAVLFSYPPPSLATLGGWSGVPYQPEEFAYLAMNTRPSAERVNDESAHTTCSTRFKAQHLVKEGAALPAVQSVVINYGTLTFASFHSGQPITRPPTASSSSLQAPPARSSPHIGGSMRPPPMEFVQDVRPASLEIYSPHSASVHSRAHKRSRTGSSDLATPLSAHSHAAYNNHGQPTPQQSPYGYAHHPISPMVSSNLATIPDSPDPYGYTHFSGELSPTMASAANVLGSFHRAHHHHPLAFQESHQAEQGFDLQGLANQMASQYEGPMHHHRPGPGEFSPSSAASSPRLGDQQQAQQGSFGMSPSTPSTYRRNHAHSASVDLAAHHLLGFCRGSTSMMAVNGSNNANIEPNYSHHPQVTASPAKSRAAPRVVGGGVSGPGPSEVATQSQQQVPRSCTSCGAQNSPEWRKGPNGVKSLCNACGLRFSRSQARKGKAVKSGQQQAKKGAGDGGGPKKKVKIEQQQQQQQAQHEQQGSTSRDFYHPSVPPPVPEPAVGFGALV